LGPFSAVSQFCFFYIPVIYGCFTSMVVSCRVMNFILVFDQYVPPAQKDKIYKNQQLLLYKLQVVCCALVNHLTSVDIFSYCPLHFHLDGGYMVVCKIS